MLVVGKTGKVWNTWKVSLVLMLAIAKCIDDEGGSDAISKSASESISSISPQLLRFTRGVINTCNLNVVHSSFDFNFFCRILLLIFFIFE